MDYMELQRRNFEAQFGSLEELGYDDKTKNESESDSGSESESDDFGGFENNSDNNDNMSDSDSDSDTDSSDSDDFDSFEEMTPKVVKLSDFSSHAPTSKADKNAARSGRAPTLAEVERKEQEKLKLTKKQQAKAVKEDDENLENDLKLQRLLKESHILAAQRDFSGADLTLQTIDYEDPTGKARKRALTSRIRTIAATNSKTQGQPKKLQKMPMNLRKAMVESRKKKAAEYEQEAKDAGIVLSKIRKGELRDLNAGRGVTVASDRLGTGVSKPKRRERGLKIPTVGRSTRNGLVISAKDIARINGSGKSGKGKGKGKRR